MCFEEKFGLGCFIPKSKTCAEIFIVKIIAHYFIIFDIVRHRSFVIQQMRISCQIKTDIEFFTDWVFEV